MAERALAIWEIMLLSRGEMKNKGREQTLTVVSLVYNISVEFAFLLFTQALTLVHCTLFPTNIKCFVRLDLELI